MKNRTSKNGKKLVLAAVLAVVALTNLPATGRAAGKICNYQYFYDAAHTQPAGYCFAACYAGGNYCIGDVTEYFARVDCGPPCA